jgi:hypothetical protein
MRKYVLAIMLVAAVGAASMEVAMAANLKITSTPLPVEHIKIVSSKPYAEVKANVEKLGRFDDRVRAFLKNNDIEGLRAALKEIAGADGLAIHYVALHGDLLALKGQRRQLIAYYIGNRDDKCEPCCRTLCTLAGRGLRQRSGRYDGGI